MPAATSDTQVPEPAELLPGDAGDAVRLIALVAIGIFFIVDSIPQLNWAALIGLSVGLAIGASATYLVVVRRRNVPGPTTDNSVLQIEAPRAGPIRIHGNEITIDDDAFLDALRRVLRDSDFRTGKTGSDDT